MLNVAVSSDENGILEYWRGGVTDRLIPDQVRKTAGIPEEPIDI